MRPFLIIVFISLSWQTSAQQADDAIIKNPTDTLKSKLFTKKNHVDTLGQNLLSRQQKIKQNTTSKLDSLDNETLGKLETEVSSLNHQLDSLSKLQLPGEKYKQKADSLYSNFQEKVLTKYKLPGDSLSPKLKNRVSEIDKTIGDKTSMLDSLFTANGLDINTNLGDKFNPSLPQQNLPALGNANLNLPGNDMRFPNTQMPNAQLPNTKLPDTNILKIDAPKSDKIPGMNDFKSVQEKVSEVADVAKNAATYAEEVKTLDPNNMEKTAELAEKQLSKIDEVGAAQAELGKAEELKKEMGNFGEQAKSPDEAKEEVLHRTKQPFVDYLKGQEEKVQTGIDKMLDYQKKYRSLQDTRYLPKPIANKMKGKPWQERVVPGYLFQVHQQLQPWTGIDISPFVGYRLSGQFRTFIGGTYRIYVDIKDFNFNLHDRAYAVRWFTHIKTINGLYVHLELERQKEVYLNKPALPKLSEVEFNKWRSHSYAGLMRLQRINKNINGTAFALYDFKDIGRTFNFNQIALRFGIEYKLKKKKKPELTSPSVN